MVVEYIDAGAVLYRTTTRDAAARAKMKVWRRQSGSCDHSFIYEANPCRYQSNSPERDERLPPAPRDTAETMMWVIGAFSLAAVVNQIAIALCRRAQATTEPDHLKQCSTEPQSCR